VNTIHELAAQGKSVQDIAISLGIARNTVRKYLRHPELAAMPHPRAGRSHWLLKPLHTASDRGQYTYLALSS
jgi:hypothetical protein